MKKHGLLFSGLLVGCLSTIAQERLAVFTDGKDTLLPCISVDFFSSMAAGQLYGAIGKDFTPKYVSVTPGRFDGKAKMDLSPVTGIGYFGVDNNAVSDYYTHFLITVIDKYKGQPHDHAAWYALQHKVWTYNVMDELGLIDRSMEDQQSAYAKAWAQFVFRYGLSDGQPKAGTADQGRSSILRKASQVYFNRKFATRETERPDSIHLADSAIVYWQQPGSHILTASYQHIPVSELELYAVELKEAVYMYIRDYQRPPEAATFIKSPEPLARYVLSLGVKTGDPLYTMHVAFGEYIVGLSPAPPIDTCAGATIFNGQ
jgi:hypothetical protein